MLDTCHLETPRIVQYSKSFLPALEQSLSAEWRPKIWREKSVGPYGVVGNFEKLGIPLIIHQRPRNPAGGDKIEILQAGEKRISEMVGWVREVYDFDAADARIMRLDMTADVKRIPVDWFRRHVRIALKQTHRTHLTVNLEIAKREAETIYGGIAPHQYRIYNKTLHRLHVLLKKHNLKRKAAGLPPETFMEVFGYDSSELRTRVERQMGAREPGKVFGMDYFGEINAAANIDPFANMIFPSSLPKMDSLDGLDLMAVLYLKQFMDEANDGLQNARNQMRRCFTNMAKTDKEREVARRKFYRKWQLYEGFLHHSEEADLVTREQLRDEYRATTMLQLAA